VTTPVLTKHTLDAPTSENPSGFAEQCGRTPDTTLTPLWVRVQRALSSYDCALASDQLGVTAGATADE
jgi:hypothetical protein